MASLIGNASNQARSHASTYTGGVKNGKPHGKGDLISQQGRHLIGEWVDGIKQGPFTRSYQAGFMWTGNYVDDKRDGLWLYHYPNSIAYKYDYVNGVRVKGPYI